MRCLVAAFPMRVGNAFAAENRQTWTCYLDLCWDSADRCIDHCSEPEHRADEAIMDDTKYNSSDHVPVMGAYLCVIKPAPERCVFQ